MPWFSSDECPICSIFILYIYVNFWTILRPAFYANTCLATPPWWNSNINDRHAKLENACWRFWKIYNFQIFGQSDRQDRSEKGSWRFGWVPSKHKCLGHFQKKCSSHNCHEISVPFLTIGVFFRCQYFVRPLFEIFEQEWIPWFELHVVEVYLVALSNKVAEIHVVMSCVCDSTQAVRFVTATCRLWQAVSQVGPKGDFCHNF